MLTQRASSRSRTLCASAMYQLNGVAISGKRACRYIRLSSTACCSAETDKPVRAGSTTGFSD